MPHLTPFRKGLSHPMQNYQVGKFRYHKTKDDGHSKLAHLKTALRTLEVHAASPGQGIAGFAVGAPHPVLLQEDGQLQLLRVDVVELDPLGKLLAAEVLVGLRPLRRVKELTCPAD